MAIRHARRLSTRSDKRGRRAAPPSSSPENRDEWKMSAMSERRKSWASSAAVRRGMQANRSRDTKPEIAVRRAVHALGLRYKVDARPLPRLNRRADLVFTKAKVAVFVDGCFWHGCPDHHTVAMANRTYWADKVLKNRERDAETNRLLSEAGWTVLRVWEHEDLASVVERVAATVRAENSSPQ